MSLGARLREERQRLGKNQTDFAAIAGASKRAMVSWEKDESAPLAPALVAWAEAGADATYILMGNRPEDRRANALQDIKEQLTIARRALLDPELKDDDVERQRTFHRNGIQALIRYDSKIMPEELRQEAEELFVLINDDAKLGEARRAKHGAQRFARDRNRRELASWFEDADVPPSETSIYMLASIATDYHVPVRTLVDVAEELRQDFIRRDNKSDGLDFHQ